LQYKSSAVAVQKQRALQNTLLLVVQKEPMLQLRCCGSAVAVQKQRSCSSKAGHAAAAVLIAFP
jgi:hypothetical protein